MEEQKQADRGEFANEGSSHFGARSKKEQEEKSLNQKSEAQSHAIPKMDSTELESLSS